eukprot:1383143-Rhodomonas_salina.1
MQLGGHFTCSAAIVSPGSSMAYVSTGHRLAHAQHSRRHGTGRLALDHVVWHVLEHRQELTENLAGLRTCARRLGGRRTTLGCFGCRATLRRSLGPLGSGDGLASPPGACYGHYSNVRPADTAQL